MLSLFSLPDDICAKLIIKFLTPQTIYNTLVNFSYSCDEGNLLALCPLTAEGLPIPFVACAVVADQSHGFKSLTAKASVYLDMTKRVCPVGRSFTRYSRPLALRVQST